MTIKDILDFATRNYDEGRTEAYYNDKGELLEFANGGDHLAKFIVMELIDTYDESASDIEQVEEAARTVRLVRDQVERVFYALDELHDKKLSEEGA